MSSIHNGFSQDYDVINGTILVPPERDGQIPATKHIHARKLSNRFENVCLHKMRTRKIKNSDYNGKEYE